MKALRSEMKMVLALVIVLMVTGPALAVEMVWMRHEPGDSQLDQYGHNGGAAIPEVATDENGRGIGNNILGIAPLSNGDYVYGRSVGGFPNVQSDWFIHNGASMNETAAATNQAGLNNSVFLDVVGLANGNFAWGRVETGDNATDFFVHSGTTALQTSAAANTRGLGNYAGMAPVAGGFVWGRTDAGEFDWFRHDGTTGAETHAALDAAGEGTGGFVGLAGLANGNFVFGREHNGATDWILRDGTDLSYITQANGTAGIGDTGVMGVVGLADGNFVWVRNHASGYDLKLHSGTTAQEIAWNHNVRGSNATFLGLAALPDGSFVMARAEPDGLLDLYQYDGTTLAEIGVLQNWRGVGAGGSLFDGMTGLVPEPASMLVLGLGGLATFLRRRRTS